LSRFGTLVLKIPYKANQPVSFQAVIPFFGNGIAIETSFDADILV